MITLVTAQNNTCLKVCNTVYSHWLAWMFIFSWAYELQNIFSIIAYIFLTTYVFVRHIDNWKYVHLRKWFILFQIGSIESIDSVKLDPSFKDYQSFLSLTLNPDWTLWISFSFWSGFDYPLVLVLSRKQFGRDLVVWSFLMVLYFWMFWFNQSIL